MPMKPENTAEYITAENKADSSRIWRFTTLDRACLRMIIRDTWIFSGQPAIENKFLYFPCSGFSRPH